MTTVKHSKSCNNGKCSHEPVRKEGNRYICCSCQCHVIEGVITVRCGSDNHDKCSGFVHGSRMQTAGDIVPCDCSCHVVE